MTRPKSRPSTKAKTPLKIEIIKPQKLTEINRLNTSSKKALSRKDVIATDTKSFGNTPSVKGLAKSPPNAIGRGTINGFKSPYYKSAQKSEWRELATHIDADMRYKNTFTRVDVLKITTGLKNRCDELANLLHYEKNKTKTSDQILKELEDAKMRCKGYQEKALKIPDLKLKIEQHHTKLE